MGALLCALLAARSVHWVIAHLIRSASHTLLFACTTSALNSNARLSIGVISFSAPSAMLLSNCRGSSRQLGGGHAVLAAAAASPPRAQY